MKPKRARRCFDCGGDFTVLILTDYGAAYCRRCMYNARR